MLLNGRDGLFANHLEAQEIALKLGAYRKLNPTPMEEAIFFDHPSGRARIQMAMDWKAGQLPTGDVK